MFVVITSLLVFFSSLFGSFIDSKQTSETMVHPDAQAYSRFLNAEGEEEFPDAILLPGFLVLQVADLAGYLVSSIAYNLSRALMFMFWL